MVSHPRTPLGARDLRPLNAPTPIRVQVNGQGEPTAVQRRAWPRARPVAAVQDRWRIDDEWWRERAVSRCYYALDVEGLLITVYHDLLTDAWSEQHG